MIIVSLEESYNCGVWLSGRVWAQMGPELDGGSPLSSEANGKLWRTGMRYKQIAVRSGSTCKHRNTFQSQGRCLPIKADGFQCH